MMRHKILRAKTVAMYINWPETCEWVLLDGDKRHWDGVYVNSDGDRNIQNEIVNEMYSDEGEFRGLKITRETAETEVRNGAYLIDCGFIL